MSKPGGVRTAVAVATALLCVLAREFPHAQESRPLFETSIEARVRIRHETSEGAHNETIATDLGTMRLRYRVRGQVLGGEGLSESAGSARQRVRSVVVDLAAPRGNAGPRPDQGARTSYWRRIDESLGALERVLRLSSWAPFGSAEPELDVTFEGGRLRYTQTYRPGNDPSAWSEEIVELEAAGASRESLARWRWPAARAPRVTTFGASERDLTLVRRMWQDAAAAPTDASDDERAVLALLSILKRQFDPAWERFVARWTGGPPADSSFQFEIIAAALDTMPAMWRGARRRRVGDAPPEQTSINRETALDASFGAPFGLFAPGGAFPTFGPIGEVAANVLRDGSRSEREFARSFELQPGSGNARATRTGEGLAFSGPFDGSAEGTAVVGFPAYGHRYEMGWSLRDLTTPFPPFELRFVTKQGDTFQPAEKARLGGEIYVEAVFKAAPQESAFDVSLSWDGGEREREVSVSRTDNPVIYRSGPLRLKSGGAGR